MPTSVLIVEDDPVFRDGFASAIAQAPDLDLAGAVPDMAGARALLPLCPDVLLVDLKLPDGNGIDLIREASRQLPACEIMVVTVFADEGSVMDSIAAGATGYLLKDASVEEIVGHVRALRAGGSPISPGIARQLLNRLPRAQRGEGGVTLSEQETRVLGLAAKGYSYDEIAELMKISSHSVQTYVKRAYRKLQVHSKVEALAEARRLGLLEA
jgi:DNA-binding NarL/FixJ family response regulator